MPVDATSADSAQKYRAIGVVLLSSVLFSTGGLLIKLVEWNPLAIAGARSLIAVFVMLAATGRPRFTWSKAQVLGALLYAATVMLFVAANKMTSAANTILLQYTAPIWVALISPRLLNERIGRRDWLAIGVTLGGMVLFFLDRLSPGNLIGNVLALISGMTLAGLLVSLRFQKAGSPIETVILGNALTALVGLPFILSSAPGGSGWLGVAVLALFQFSLPWILFTRAVKHLTALEAVLTQLIEPLLNPIWAFLFLREIPGPWGGLGGLVVLLSVALRNASALLRRGVTGEKALSADD